MSTPIFPQAVWASGTNENSLPANDNSLRNEAINRNVISRVVTAQPVSPGDGDVYILPTTHTGTQWATFETDDLVIYRSGTWYAFTPVEGVVVNVNGVLYEYTGPSSGWDAISGGGGGVQTIVAGTNISVDDTDPANPIVSATGSGFLSWINVKESPYNAAGDGTTDDTTAIQDAIDAVLAAGGGTLYFPPGIYQIDGALQDGSRGNAQLLFPSLDAVDDEQITIEFMGAWAPPPVFSVVGATPVPDNHSILRTSLNTGAGGSFIGGWGPSGSFLDFTMLHVKFTNLTVRMPSNPVLTAVDLSHVTTCELDNFIVDVGSYYVQGLTEPTTSTSYGIRLPMNGNGAFTRLGAVNVIGFYKGYQAGEHTCFEQVAAWGCKIGLEPIAADHASKLQRFMTVHCERGIVPTGAHYMDIDQFNIEHAASGWWITDADVDDSSSFLRGNLNWHVVLAGVGVDGTFTVNGGARMNISRVGFRNGVEQVSFSADTTLAGRHANKQILHPSADTTGRTFTIPANSSVPYQIGTCLTFVNQDSAGTLSIAITSDTMRLAGTGTTGTRTLTDNGLATAVKITSTEWIISGSGLS